MDTSTLLRPEGPMELKEELSVCDRIDLRYIGSIQSNTGYVIVVDAEDEGVLKIRSASSNTPAIPEMLGRPLMEHPWFASKDENQAIVMEVIEKHLALAGHGGGMSPSRTYAMMKVLSTSLFSGHIQGASARDSGSGDGSADDVAPVPLTCSVVSGGASGHILIEFEQIREPQDMSSFTHPRVRSTLNPTPLIAGVDILSRLKLARTVEEVTQTMVESIMDVETGYSRGMVYRFTEDHCGEVVYEKVRDQHVLSSSYLGLRFPATDIPNPARELFRKNIIRIVRDVGAPWIGMEGAAVDLSMSCMRQCSNVHCHYLRNMGVKATLSVAIVVEEKLWGLYAFHSYTEEVFPKAENRILFEIAAAIGSIRLESCLREQEVSRSLLLNRGLVALQSYPSLTAFLSDHWRTLLPLFEAHALCILDPQCDDVITFGDQAVAADAQDFVHFQSLLRHASLQQAAGGSGRSHGEEGGGGSSSATDDAEARESRLMSGAGPDIGGRGISGTLTSSRITLTDIVKKADGSICVQAYFKMVGKQLIIVRGSVLHDVKWAGNPDKSMLTDGMLSPRTSFEMYVEENKRECRPYSPACVALMDVCFRSFGEYAMQKDLINAFRVNLEQSNRDFAEATQNAKENFEFFAAMSHELRTPFFGVMSALQTLMSSSSSERDFKEVVQTALECGDSMLNTLNDILSIAKNKNSVEICYQTFSPANLVRECEKVMKPFAYSKDLKLNVVYEDANGYLNKNLVGDETRVRQAVVNFVNNAVKFTTQGGVKVNVGCLDTYAEAVAWAKTATTGYAGALWWGHQIGFVKELPRVLELASLKERGGAVKRGREDSGGGCGSGDDFDDFVGGGAVGGGHSRRSRGIAGTGSSSGGSGGGGGGGSSGGVKAADTAPGNPAYLVHPKRYRWMVVNVKDTGCGVAPEDLDRIFRPYEQLSSGVSKRYKGTGLGLHICLTHVQILHGFLGACSTLHAGTSLCVGIPFLIQQSNVTVVPMETSPSPSPNPTHEEVPATVISRFDSTGSLTSHFTSSTLTCPLTASAKHMVNQASLSSSLPGTLEQSASSSQSVPPPSSPPESQSTPPMSPPGQVSKLCDRAPPALDLSTLAGKLKDTPAVLIVDDYAVNLKLMERKIKMCVQGGQIQIIKASDGLEAVEAFKKHLMARSSGSGSGGSTGDSTDTNDNCFMACIFIDYHMPNMSGMDAIIAIRDIEATYSRAAGDSGCEDSGSNSRSSSRGSGANWRPGRVPIMALTADVSDSVTSAFINAGADDVLTKPTPGGLIERLVHKFILQSVDGSP